MQAPIFAYKNFFDSATLSGGSWLAALPLANIQDRRLAKLARSSTDSTADAQLLATHSAARSLPLAPWTKA